LSVLLEVVSTNPLLIRHAQIFDTLCNYFPNTFTQFKNHTIKERAKKVLVVDLGPQASLTFSLGYPHPDELPVTITYPRKTVTPPAQVLFDYVFIPQL